MDFSINQFLKNEKFSYSNEKANISLNKTNKQTVHPIHKILPNHKIVFCFNVFFFGDFLKVLFFIFPEINSLLYHSLITISLCDVGVNKAKVETNMKENCSIKFTAKLF